MVFGILLAVAGGAIGSFVTDKLISGGTDNIEIEIIADDNSYKINVNPNNPSAITFSTDSDITNKSAIMKIKNGDVCDTTNITLYTTVVDPIFREGKVSYVHRPLLNEKYDSFHTFLYVCYTYFYECIKNLKGKVKYATKDQLNDDVNNMINSYVISDPNSEDNTGFNYKFQWLLVSNVFPLFNEDRVSFNLTSTNFLGQDTKQTIITSNGRSYKILKLVAPMDNSVRLLLYTPNNPGGQLVNSIREITEHIKNEL